MEIEEKDIHKELSNFSNFLKKSGLKITQQRLLVAETIFRLGTHFSVESLSKLMKNQTEDISRATVYRIVSLMQDSGLITEHQIGSSEKIFEYIPRQKHHDHIVCVDCGRIDEFKDDEIEKIQIKIADRYGYDLKDHSLNLYGRCRELKEKGTCSRAPKKP